MQASASRGTSDLAGYSAVSVRVFISYSHDSEAHASDVLALARRLQNEGFEAHLDQFIDDPPGGWAAWCAEQLREARYVLMVCTPTYT